ncbi:MAG: hypothetical protein KBT05_04365 [Bacteroidales bacterium]|nr:hypothetical protein [Candidatus Cryptobacteroides caccocaballi]
MKKNFKVFAAAVLGIFSVACSSLDKMAEMAENVNVTCNPAVLEVVAGVIQADVTVTYPAEYFNKKAIVEVTPVIVFDGGESKMAPFTFQGEKVEDNYEVCSYDGGTITKHVRFPYVEGMENCHLELRGVATNRTQEIELPSKKVADGANTTYMLVCKGGVAELKADGYQDVIPMTAEGQILYSINSSDVASKELTSASIKNFQDAVNEINANERKTLVGTEVVAYASPDGGAELNSKLSGNRAKSAEKAWGKVTKKLDVADPTVSSVGQDWEGFQELVAASDIEDKDLIIRVLSMYSDAAVREQEIKNMSAVYTTLAKEVLPELRRARFIANVEYQNYTSEELSKLVDENIDVLDEAALLRAATLAEKSKDKIAIYDKAISKYNSKTAQYNKAVVYVNDGDYRKAENAIKGLDEDADVLNIKGIIALNDGNLAAAGQAFNAAGTDAAKENLAVAEILGGKYESAAARLAGKEGCNAALAQILVGNLAAAEKALTCNCPKSNYLRAVIAARQGKAEAVKTNLDKATKESKELARRAETDIEFAQYR